ncbi:N-acetylmuramoyl-L-alanine amidase [Sinisalibacter lacisalsi]|uniref:N-acetylmuramoyl-L-alanine amidase n=1 Tax=Sinisalibacter lacisalsi TaxID=1526570 RepID=A0ABQ1QHQ8_9RHOB|nr:N-acetylmuramoyl-L-alanine amidase [Sinisalibacter lacisalsi]GGD26632.1 N-acetylmuramoyl-L-alanine amidase [Sinisalibacter lacisalsi]
MSGPGAVISRPSPNFGDRRDGLRPELVVLHYTAMPDAEAALERLCAPEHEVSAHYLIARDDRLFRLVDEDKRAWHAGAGEWGGRGDVNSRSIGIELDNCGHSPFSEPQMARLEWLLSDILARWRISPEGVIAHSDFAPTRKTDPGPRFDWRRLAVQGLAVWPEPAAPGPDPDDAAFLAAARAFGYPTGDGFAPVLTAFRARFRPGACGPLDGSDMAMIEDLARRFPVDRPAARA